MGDLSIFRKVFLFR